MSEYTDFELDELWELQGVSEAIEEQNKILLMTPEERQAYRRKKDAEMRAFSKRMQEEVDRQQACKKEQGSEQVTGFTGSFGRGSTPRGRSRVSDGSLRGRQR